MFALPQPFWRRPASAPTVAARLAGACAVAARATSTPTIRCFVTSAAHPILEEGARSISSGLDQSVLDRGRALFGGRWLLLSFTHAPNASFEGLTGFKSPAVWLVEKFAHIIIILFVFYFLSSFMPGEAGKQFRAAMSNIVMHAIKFFFKFLEQGVHFVGRLLLKTAGIEVESKKKKK